MNITIITDCCDNNAAARQVAQSSGLFKLPVHVCGVKNDIEAAGNLIDILDIDSGETGPIFVNVAPRSNQAWWLSGKHTGFDKQRKNGTPFGYFYYNNRLVVSTIDGVTLSLVKKLGIAEEIHVFDIDTVLAHAVEQGYLDEKDKEDIAKTQFRSLNFLPRAAHFVHEGKDVPTSPLPLTDIPDMPETVWWIDNFGNAKTTLFEDDVEDREGGVMNLPFYAQLKDVPFDTVALVKGSSGFKEKRFLEIMIQGGNASEKQNLSVGMDLSQETVSKEV